MPSSRALCAAAIELAVFDNGSPGIEQTGFHVHSDQRFILDNKDQSFPIRFAAKSRSGLRPVATVEFFYTWGLRRERPTRERS